MPDRLLSAALCLLSDFLAEVNQVIGGPFGKPIQYDTDHYALIIANQDKHAFLWEAGVLCRILYIGLHYMVADLIHVPYKDFPADGMVNMAESCLPLYELSGNRNETVDC